MYLKGMTRAEYAPYMHKFNPVKFDPDAAVTLRTPAAIEFNLQPGKQREVVIEIDRPAPVVLGVELRGEGLAPEGIRMEEHHSRSH